MTYHDVVMRLCVHACGKHSGKIVLKAHVFRISRKERGYSSHPLFSLQLLPSTPLLTHRWRAQGLVEKSSLLGLKLAELWATLGGMALPKRASGNPLCECGRKLAVLSPELQETWAADKGREWGTRPGWSGS